MTYSEAEEFIQTVLAPGDIMDVFQVMKKYRDKTLKEALEDYEFHQVINDIANHSAGDK